MLRIAISAALIILSSGVIEASNAVPSSVNTVDVPSVPSSCGEDNLLPFVPVEAKSEPRNAGFFLFTAWMRDVEEAARRYGDITDGWIMPLNSGDFYYRGTHQNIFDATAKAGVIISEMDELHRRVRFTPEKDKTIHVYSKVFSNHYPDMSHIVLETDRGTIIYPGRIRQVDHMADTMETWLLYEVCEAERDSLEMPLGSGIIMQQDQSIFSRMASFFTNW